MLKLWSWQKRKRKERHEKKLTHKLKCYFRIGSRGLYSVLCWISNEQLQQFVYSSEIIKKSADVTIYSRFIARDKIHFSSSSLGSCDIWNFNLVEFSFANDDTQKEQTRVDFIIINHMREWLFVDSHSHRWIIDWVWYYRRLMMMMFDVPRVQVFRK